MSLTNLTNAGSMKQSDWANHFLRSLGEPVRFSERKISSPPPTVKNSHYSSSDVSTTLPLNKIPLSSEPKPRWSSENFRVVSSGASFNTDHVTQASPPANIPFILSYPAAENLPAVQQPSQTPAVSTSSPPLTPEKKFFEKHNIMKWVIDDQDDGDIPGLSSSHSQGSCPVTSQIAVEDLKLEENTEVKACPTARYVV